MAENSSIEWTDHTFNPWWGCMKVSPGCKNCYAETFSNRYHGPKYWGPNSERRKFEDKHWNQLLKWNREAEKAGVPAKVFTGSMCDIAEYHPEVDAERERLWRMIPDLRWLRFQLLTKRPENYMKVVPGEWVKSGTPDNVIFGCSIVNQEELDKHWMVMYEVKMILKASVFYSMEPLLGPVDLARPLNYNSVAWIIVGGESGPKARPMHPDWARSIRDQCDAAGVPFFFKQWGEYTPYGDRLSNGSKTKFATTLSGGANGYTNMFKVGKKAAGAALEGKEHKQFPQVLIK